jgi:two-component system LytT family response regulator
MINKDFVARDGISAIIVDDELYCCDALEILLRSFHPNVSVVAICKSGWEALEKIRELDPQLVFLDVEMPGMNGFQLLEQFPEVNFHLIFTTSYDQYAIRAIRFSALDYLMKPIDREELDKAIQKLLKKIKGTLTEQLEILLQKVHHSVTPVQRIALPTVEGLELIPVSSIISCSSRSNYSEFFMKEKQKRTVCRTLKEVEEMLEEHAFLRVHHSHVVNLNEINKYIKGEGGYLVMSDGSTVDVARSKKEILVKRLLK